MFLLAFSWEVSDETWTKFVKSKMLVSVGWFQIMTNEKWFFDQTSIKDCLFQCKITWFLGISSRSNLKRIPKILVLSLSLYVDAEKKSHQNAMKHQTTTPHDGYDGNLIWIFPIWISHGFPRPPSCWCHLQNARVKRVDESKQHATSYLHHTWCAFWGVFFLKWGGGLRST